MNASLKRVSPTWSKNLIRQLAMHDGGRDDCIPADCLALGGRDDCIPADCLALGGRDDCIPADCLALARIGTRNQ